MGQGGRVEGPLLLVRQLGIKQVGGPVEGSSPMLARAGGWYDTQLPTPLALPPPHNTPSTQVPTFIFYRNGEEVGRHVGSSRGDLIGQILAQQARHGIQPPPPPGAAAGAQRRPMRRGRYTRG